MQRGGSFPNLQGFATSRSAGRLCRHSVAGTLARAGVGPVVSGQRGGPAARTRVGCSVGIADAIAQRNRGPDADSVCDTVAKPDSGPDAWRDADPLAKLKDATRLQTPPATFAARTRSAYGFAPSCSY